MPVSELFLRLLDLVRDDHDLPGVGLDDGSNKRRDSKPVALVSEDTVDQLADPLNPHRGDNAKFGQMAARGIYQHGPLTDQQGPGPVDHKNRLLIDRFHRDETHGRARDRFADRLGINGVILTAFYVRLHVLRGHQFDLMSQGDQLSGPVMSCAARFHAYQAGWQIFEESQKLGSSQLSVRKHMVAPVDHVHLEKPFRDINAKLSVRTVFPPLPSDFSPRVKLGVEGVHTINFPARGAFSAALRS
jgi:hypothetical protein